MKRKLYIPISVICLSLFYPCSSPGDFGQITFENQTEQTVDVYVDTLHLLTLQPASSERCKIAVSHHRRLIIKSPSIGYLHFGYIMDESGYEKDSATVYHVYSIEARVNDSIIYKFDFDARRLFNEPLLSANPIEIRIENKK